MLRIKQVIVDDNFDLRNHRVINSATPLNDSDLVTKKYVDSKLIKLDWQESVISFLDFTTNEPFNPADGDRYISTQDATPWVGNFIYEFNISAWQEIAPDDGTVCYDEATKETYIFNGLDWVITQVAATSWGAITGDITDQTDLQNIINTISLPLGGLENDVLKKQSDSDFDYIWSSDNTSPILTANQIVLTDSLGTLTTTDWLTAFNKNFGNTIGTVSEGNHTHNSIISDIGIPMVYADCSFSTGFNYANFYNPIGQTFIASATGIVDTIELNNNNTSDSANLTITIYKGFGYTGKIISNTTNLIHGIGFTNFNIENVSLIGGDEYTFKITRSSGSLAVANVENGYVDGTGLDNVGTPVTTDIYFKLFGNHQSQITVSSERIIITGDIDLQSNKIYTSAQPQFDNDLTTKKYVDSTIIYGHNNLNNIEIAASGVTYGHIDNIAQTIHGIKTFNSDIIGNGTINTSNYLKSGFKLTKGISQLPVSNEVDMNDTDYQKTLFNDTEFTIKDNSYIYDSVTVIYLEGNFIPSFIKPGYTFYGDIDQSGSSLKSVIVNFESSVLNQVIIRCIDPSAKYFWISCIKSNA